MPMADKAYLDQFLICTVLIHERNSRVISMWKYEKIVQMPVVKLWEKKQKLTSKSEVPAELVLQNISFAERKL